MKMNKEVCQLAQDFMYKYGMSSYSALDLAHKKIKEKEKITSLCQQARKYMEDWFKRERAKNDANKILNNLKED